MAESSSCSFMSAAAEDVDGCAEISTLVAAVLLIVKLIICSVRHKQEFCPNGASPLPSLKNQLILSMKGFQGQPSY